MLGLGANYVNYFNYFLSPGFLLEGEMSNPTMPTTKI